MRVLVLSGYGINCEDETLHAFEAVGFKGNIVHINDLIENPKKIESPFMTIGFPTKEGKTIFPAGVHQSDGTARAQLLKKEENPSMWNLIFKSIYRIKITGVESY